MIEKNEPLDELDTPFVAIDLDKAEHNLRRWQTYCDEHGLRNRPHIKTHKLIEMAALQIELRAIGLACQKLSEARAMIDGLSAVHRDRRLDVMIPYNIVGSTKAERAAALAGTVDLTLACDALEVVRPLAQAFAAAGKTASMIVEFDSGAGRCGVSTVEEAVADLNFVYAATARERGQAKPVVLPRDGMTITAARIAAGEKVAVLFGPERAGLENEDVAKANAIITVPVNPAFPSLNLGQCVLLTGYEWMRARGEVVHLDDAPKGEWASGEEIERLAAHYEGRLEAAGFFFPEAKAAGMKVNLRNLWSRMRLTRADVQMLHGIMRQMVRWKERG